MAEMCVIQSSQVRLFSFLWPLKMCLRLDNSYTKAFCIHLSLDDRGYIQYTVL